MSVVLVVPSIVPDMTRDCLATLHPTILDPRKLPSGGPWHQDRPIVHVVRSPDQQDGQPTVLLVVVYNTPEHNFGVAGSWDVGIDHALSSGADWLTILSAAVRFGPEGGRDFLAHLDIYRHADPPVLGVEAGDGLGWHLIAFPRHVLEKVGRFDEIFHPAYKEDLDYSRRIQLAYGIDSTAPGFVGPLWPKVDVDAALTGVAHGIKEGGVTVDFMELERLYVKKWGAKSPDECFTHPYDDPELDYTFTGPHP